VERDGQGQHPYQEVRDVEEQLDHHRGSGHPGEEEQDHPSKGFHHRGEEELDHQHEEEELLYDLDYPEMAVQDRRVVAWAYRP
jgi:hypothetical protein